MNIDPVTLSAITAAVSVLRDEYVKDIASEAGKSTWAGVKRLFGWSSDPEPEELPERVLGTLTISPELVQKALELLKSSRDASVARLVGKIETENSTIVVVETNLGIMHIGGSPRNAG